MPIPRIIKDLTIKNKFLLLFVLTAFLYLLFILLIQRFVLYSSYHDLETHNAEVNMKRIVSSIERENYQLNNFCHGWSSWNVLYSFMSDRNTLFIKDNLTYTTFISGNFNFICMVGLDYNVIIANGYQSGSKVKKFPVSLTDSSFIMGSGILSFRNTDISRQNKSGIVITEYGLMIVSVRPVLKSDNTGPERGYVIMGKYLDNPAINNLRGQTKLDFSILQIDDKIPGHILNELTREYHTYSDVSDPDKTVLYSIRPDIFGRDAYIIRLVSPNIITKEGNKVIKVSISILLSGMILLLVFIWAVLNRYVLKPIDILRNQVKAVTRGDYKENNSLRSNDELGLLSLVIDDMAKTIDLKNKALKSVNSKLELLSITDGLTNLYNRRHFDEVIRYEWDRARRSGEYLSLIMCDIDFFKSYNDMYGHQAGDECIMGITRAMKSVMRREIDNIFRYGGEEFAAVIPNMTLAGAVHIAGLFKKAVAVIGLRHEGSTISGGIVTISAGVSSVIPGMAADYTYLVELADNALYRSKKSGRNRIYSAETGMNGEVIFTEHPDE